MDCALFLLQCLHHKEDKPIFQRSAKECKLFISKQPPRPFQCSEDTSTARMQYCRTAHSAFIWSLGTADKSHCIFGIFLLTPPGGALGKSEVTLPTIRGSSSDIRSKQQQRRSTPPPNVIVFVHESLSGAAMQSARGIDAAPFFHSMRSNPNFYDFRFARTTAGTTPIATPSLLTGLMPFDDDGVELVKRASLASDFKRLGYDTSCFAAYGADWTGNAWEILSYMLMPGFDAIFDPKATGDALVNEYGMDDRVLSNHFVQWLKTRRAPSNVTTSDTNDDSDEMSSNATSGAVPDSNRENGKITRDQTEKNQRRKQKQKEKQNPFFSLIVQNNNHFPHLMHETYSGDPDCERKKDDMGSNSNMTTVESGGKNPILIWVLTLMKRTSVGMKIMAGARPVDIAT